MMTITGSPHLSSAFRYLKKTASNLPSPPADAREKLGQALSRLKGQDARPQIIKSFLEDLDSRSLREIKGKWLHSGQLRSSQPLDQLLIQTLGSPSFQELAAAEEQERLGNLLAAQSIWAAVRRDEMLRILVEIHREETDNKGAVNTPIYVLESSELETFLKWVRTHNESPASLQLIVRNDVHYTCLNVRRHKSGLKITIFDAAQDPRMREWLQALDQENYRFLFVGQDLDDKLQLDGRSCSIFSLHHALQLAKEPQWIEDIWASPFLEKREDLDGMLSVPWEALPSNMHELSQKTGEGDLNIENLLKRWVELVAEYLETWNCELGSVGKIAYSHPFEQLGLATDGSALD